MTTRELYMEKKSEVHTPAEVAAAYENSPALVFTLAENYGAFDKIKLFGEIWEILSSAILTKCDLAIVGKEPQLRRDMFFLVLTNATKEETASIYEKIEGSGIIPSGFVIYPEKRAGIRICAYTTFPKDSPRPVYLPKKANLFVDGEDLLLTVRNFSKSDRAALKADGFIKNVKDIKSTEN